MRCLLTSSEPELTFPEPELTFPGEMCCQGHGSHGNEGGEDPREQKTSSSFTPEDGCHTLVTIIPNHSAQRRSQVSLAGGADRIPGGGGINLNTYSYGKRDSAA